jgi:hypothetical protein
MLAGAYGWTPRQVAEQIEEYGEEWLIAMVRHIISDQVEDRRWLIAVTPLSRTPDSQKGSRALQRYGRTLHASLDSLMPWRKKEKRERLLDQSKKKDSGSAAVQASERMARKMGL